MEAFEELTRTEQALLLGFLPLLGATGTLGSALAAAACTVVSATCVFVVSRIIAQRVGDVTRWLILLTLGFGLGYALAGVVSYISPVTQSSAVYLAVVGVTPLVYAGAGTLYGPRQLAALFARFVAIVLAFGVVRELLGSGTVLGRPLVVLETGPIGILSSSTGAWLLFAAAVLMACVVRLRRSANTEVPR